MDFISVLEKHLGKEAKKEYLPMQPGDVYATYANIKALNEFVGYEPSTNIEEGLKIFVNWYKEFYKS